MSKCSNCGIELPESAKFCPECGAPYMPDEGVASAEPEGPQKNICEKCGLELPAAAKFCTVCGGKAIIGSAVVAPTIGTFSGANTVSSGGIMMDSISREDIEKESEPTIEPISLGEMGAVPEIGEMGTVPEMSGTGAVPQVGEMGSVPEMGGTSAIPEISEAPRASVTMPGVSAVPQPASPISQPVEPGRPISAVSQPISASQPVSASPIIPPVSGTATAVMPNTVNTLNPNIQSGTMPTYNAQPAAPGVNLGKPGATGASGAPGATGAQVLPTNTQPLGAISSPTKKKMSIGGKIGIIAGSVAAAAAVAAGVFFAVDKASFLSTVMGKEKYAVMVESKAITNAASKIDAQSLSDGVGAMSEVYASMATINTENMSGAMGDIEDMTGTIPMMYPSAGITYTTNLQEYDMAEYISAINELYLKNYGANSIKENVSVDVEVGDSFKSLIGEDEATVDEIVKLINNTKLDCDVIVEADAMQADYNVVLDQAQADCKVIINSNNEMYLALPFASDKAIRITFPVSTEEIEETPVLQLDKAELERIIKSVVESYLMNYKAAAIEMEKGSVEVAGVKIEGKAITAEFKGETLKKLFTDAVEVIAKDKYLQTEFVNYCKEIGIEDMTAEKFESEIMDTFDFEATDGDRLVITTIIDKQGNILARHFEAFSETSDETPTMGYFVNDKQAAFEMVFGEEGSFTVKADIKSKTDCNLAINFKYDSDVDPQEISFNVNCTGVKTAKLGNSEVPVGTYVFSMQLPEDFEDQLGGGAQALAAINNMTLTVSSNVSDDGKGQNMLARLDAASYGSAQINIGMTLENDTVGEYPANLIDLTPAMQQGTLDNATMEQLKAYLDEVGAAYEDIKSKLSGYSVFKELPEFTNPLDQSTAPSYGDDNLTLEELTQYIAEDVQELNEYANLVDPSDTEMINRITGLQQKYASMSVIVSNLSSVSKDTEGYAEALEELEDEYWDLFDELWDIEIEIDESSGTGSGQQALLPQVDLNSISKMQYGEVQALMEAYNAVFEVIEDNEDILITNNDLQKLYDTAEEEYYDVEHDWEYFYNDLKRGTLNISLLNTLRGSMKKYVPAVQALVEALQAEGLM